MTEVAGEPEATAQLTAVVPAVHPPTKGVRKYWKKIMSFELSSPCSSWRESTAFSLSCSVRNLGRPAGGRQCQAGSSPARCCGGYAPGETSSAMPATAISQSNSEVDLECHQQARVQFRDRNRLRARTPSNWHDDPHDMIHMVRRKISCTLEEQQGHAPNQIDRLGLPAGTP